MSASVMLSLCILAVIPDASFAATASVSDLFTSAELEEIEAVMPLSEALPEVLPQALALFSDAGAANNKEAEELLPEALAYYGYQVL